MPDNLRLAIYAGTFDPLTSGHVDIIDQACTLFKGQLIVAIGVNPGKKCEYSLGDRLGMLDRCRISAKFLASTTYDGYLIDYARKVGASHIVRGIRNVSDFESEKTMSLVNRDLDNNIGSVFLMPDRRNMEISSTLVKGLVGYKRWIETVSMYVPRYIVKTMCLKHNMRESWVGLCDRLSLGSEANYAFFEEIYQKYTEPHRFYHNLIHIWSRLGEIQKHNDLNLELAWWFHDSIYNPTSKDNELQSSNFAYRIMYAMGVQENERLEVHRLIMATQHNCLLSDPTAQLIADIDLLGLADSRFEFDENSANIRKEFSMYSDEEYKKGRLEFLENFCKRSKIYYTKTYSDQYDREGAAKKNLAREIERLRA